MEFSQKPHHENASLRLAQAPATSGKQLWHQNTSPVSPTRTRPYTNTRHLYYQLEREPTPTHATCVTNLSENLHQHMSPVLPTRMRTYTNTRHLCHQHAREPTPTHVTCITNTSGKTYTNTRHLCHQLERQPTPTHVTCVTNTSENLHQHTSPVLPTRAEEPTPTPTHVTCATNSSENLHKHTSPVSPTRARTYIHKYDCTGSILLLHPNAQNYVCCFRSYITTRMHAFKTPREMLCARTAPHPIYLYPRCYIDDSTRARTRTHRQSCCTRAPPSGHRSIHLHTVRLPRSKYP